MANWFYTVKIKIEYDEEDGEGRICPVCGVDSWGKVFFWWASLSDGQQQPIVNLLTGERFFTCQSCHDAGHNAVEQ